MSEALGASGCLRKRISYGPILWVVKLMREGKTAPQLRGKNPTVRATSSEAGTYIVSTPGPNVVKSPYLP